MITVRLFAMLKNVAKRETIEYDIKGPVTVAQLSEMVAKDIPALKEALSSRSTLISINQEFAGKNDIVKDGDEVAYLPPFSGG